MSFNETDESDESLERSISSSLVGLVESGHELRETLHELRGNSAAEKRARRGDE